MAVVTLQQEDIMMLPLWQDYRFRSPDQEKEFQQQLINVKAMAIKHGVISFFHIGGFFATGKNRGYWLSSVYLGLPIVTALYFLLLALARFKHFRYASYANSLILLMAFTTEMLAMHIFAGDLAHTVVIEQGVYTEMLHETAVQRYVWPNLLYALIALFLCSNTTFDKATLLLHIALPVGLALTMGLSPHVSFDTHIVLSGAMFSAISLWLNLERTFNLRKLFMAEVAARNVREAELGHMEAAREADNMLNHSLKNAMADSSGLIEMFMTDPSPKRVSLLAQAQERLQWGMQWCKQRLAILKLTSGSYVPKPTRVDLQKFVGMLVQGRDVQVIPFQAPAVMLDETGPAVMLENVLTNASRHGDPAGPDVRLRVDLRPCADPTVPGHHLSSDLVFEVTNRADPAKPKITDEFVAKALRGETVQSASALSEGLGLQHIFMAAATLGVDASLRQEADTVVFRARTTVQVLPDPIDPDDGAPGPLPPPRALPAGLTFLCLDDSAVACRFLAANLEHRVPGSTVRSFGADVEEVDQFMEAALAGAAVVVVDQHLEFGATTVYGTDLMRRLVAVGYPGVLCIRSANASEADEALYRRSGAHCTLDKADRAEDVVRAIAAAYWQNAVAARAPSLDGPHAEPSRHSLDSLVIHNMDEDGPATPTLSPPRPSADRLLDSGAFERRREVAPTLRSCKSADAIVGSSVFQGGLNVVPLP